MRDILADNPLLLLFVVTGVGFVLGRISVRGVGLGVAAILFTGIAAGAVDERFVLPDILSTFGLAIFVYTIGLSSGPGFVGALRRRGLGANLLVALVLAGAALVTLALGALAGLDGPMRAGLFAGSLTNTPALAAVVELLERTGDGGALQTPVVGYSVAYPAGVLGTLAGVWLYRRAVGAERATTTDVDSCTVRVQRGGTVAEIEQRCGGVVRVARVRSDDRILAPSASTPIAVGDLAVLVGEPDVLRSVIDRVGEPTASPLTTDRRSLDFRRIFLSDPTLAGRTVGELGLPDRFGAVITRVRRGDVDLVARDDTVLELGDRVRVVAPPERMRELGRYLGDSYRALAEVDIAAVSIGLAAGIALGLVPVPLPGGGVFRLGSAGGPLLVGLALGTVHRTGRMTWTMPYAANLTLRQLGTMLFLASIGTRAGQSFASTLSDGGILTLLAVGATITAASTCAVLVLGHRLLGMPPGVLTGVLAGHQTQPATLAFAVEAAGDDQPNVGYSTVFPTAMVVKIVLAQLLTGALLT